MNSICYIKLWYLLKILWTISRGDILYKEEKPKAAMEINKVCLLLYFCHLDYALPGGRLQNVVLSVLTVLQVH
jgi:hypothetical protein